MKNALEGINSRLHEAEDQISNLEEKLADNQKNKNKKEFFKNTNSLRDLWHKYKT